MQLRDYYLIINLLTCLKNLTISLEEEILFLSKYNLTPNELRFIQTLLILQEEGIEDLFGDYIKVLKNAGVNLRDLILGLQEKEIILKSYKCPKEGISFDPTSIPFNKNFIKNLYKSSFEMGKELFEEYPQFSEINGNLVPLRSVAKHFDSLEQAYFKYSRAISWNPEKHQAIIELVKWAKDNNLINMSLSSFIINNSWLDLQAIKDGNITNINFDSIRSL